MPRISLVIPAFNEEAFLPQLLDSVRVARARYLGGPDAIEVVVADNASTDSTAEIALSRGCRLAQITTRSIAAARNGGARAAEGEILAFVDADCTIHPDTFNAIERTLASGRAVVGATGARFSRTSVGIAATMLLGSAIARLVRFDIGVVFCRRMDWEAVGGYNEELLCAEDLEIIQDLKRLGRPTGRRFSRAKGVRATTSARKFDLHGDWHYFLMGPVTTGYFLLCNRSGLERQLGKSFVQSYWYAPRKTAGS